MQSSRFEISCTTVQVICLQEQQLCLNMKRANFTVGYIMVIG